MIRSISGKPGDDLRHRQDLAPLVEQLSREMSVDEVMAILDKALGDGFLKQALLASVFAASNDSYESLIAHTKTLEKGALPFALNALYERAADGAHPGENLNHFLSSIDLTSSNVSFISTNFQVELLNLDNARAKRQRLDQILDLVNGLAPEKAEKLLGPALDRTMKAMPFDVWKKEWEMAASGATLPKNAASDTVNYMIRDNPFEALKTLTADPGGTPEFASRAMYAWISTSSELAKQWYAENSASLSPGMKEGADAAMARKMADTGDPAAAEQMAMNIQDGDLRKSVQEAVDAAKLEAIKKQAELSPSTTVDSFVNGDLAGSDLGFKDSVNLWATKNLGDFENWYGKNQQRLSETQRDVISESFITESVKQGDYQNANLWVDQISDKESKKRLKILILQSQPAN